MRSGHTPRVGGVIFVGWIEVLGGSNKRLQKGWEMGVQLDFGKRFG
jgi:hypothetical protein